VSARVLVSYHYHRDSDLDELVARFGGNVDLIADSGAYSAYSTGAVIDREAYSSWLHRWDHLLTVKSNLDVIGSAEQGADNLAWLTAQGHTILPVFHVGEPFDVLRSMCEVSPYVALGGLVPHLASGAGNANRPQLMRWLIKAHLIAQKTGTALHGFGCTGSLFLRDLPFYSVDSSSYMFARKRCLIYVWDDRRHVINSFHCRDTGAVRRHAHALTRAGLDPGRVSDPGFMVNGTENFDEDRVELTTTCLRSFISMEKFLRARHNVTTPLEDVSDLAAMAGTKVYFVNINTSYVDIEPIARVAREGLL
jgi:hypothetical protein